MLFPVRTFTLFRYKRVFWRWNVCNAPHFCIFSSQRIRFIFFIFVFSSFVRSLARSSLATYNASLAWLSLYETLCNVCILFRNVFANLCKKTRNRNQMTLCIYCVYMLLTFEMLIFLKKIAFSATDFCVARFELFTYCIVITIALCFRSRHNQTTAHLMKFLFLLPMQLLLLLLLMMMMLLLFGGVGVV